MILPAALQPMAHHRSRRGLSRWRAAVVAAGLTSLVVGGTLPVSASPAPAGVGNYCSVTWDGGGWGFTSDPGGGDPCAAATNNGAPGSTVERKGLYSAKGVNNVVVRCNPDGSWLRYFYGAGNGPLTKAYEVALASRLPGCVFTVAPKWLPVFDAPFSLSANHTLITGFDFARPPYTTIDVAKYGQVGSAAATVVDWKGRDKSGKGYLDNHAGHDWLLPKGTPIKAVADGVVVEARDWQSPCSGSDSSIQKEVAIRHTIQSIKGYHEQFVTYYAHLGAYKVAKGQSVKQGDTIGLSGNTGCSSAPHLHFGTLRLTNTAANRVEKLEFFDGPQHSDGANFAIDAYGFDAPKGFDPWARLAYPAGALSIDLWKPTKRRRRAPGEIDRPGQGSAPSAGGMLPTRSPQPYPLLGSPCQGRWRTTSLR